MYSRFIRFLVSLCGIFLSASFSPYAVSASEYFNRDYAVIYTVNESGVTNVAIGVTLTNTTSEYYASSDKIQLGFENVTNVTARDADGSITPHVVHTEDGSAIELKFNNRVVGKGNALKFSITFNSTDIARQQGEIWEINIPGIADPTAFSHFNVEVRVPESFGEPAYIKPAQKDKSLLFSKEQLGTSGISIAYGDTQYYALDLVYHLQNRNLFPIKTEIALPPSTAYQNVKIDTIEPKPQNVVLDKDGNWLAEYLLLPSQKMDVRVKGHVIVHRVPTSKVVLSEEQIKAYTEEKQYWDTTNSQIKELAQKLKTPEAIYDYVSSTLTYDFNRVTLEQPRLGAVNVLKEPQSAVCLEFTDLFIAIARAAGIPTREINGFAYTHNQKQRPLSLSQDILHAWPEYYDKVRQQWIMVDPTWGNTTGGIDYFNILDFDHIVFVRKGIDSTYPIPAGGYKYSGDENKKDVSVAFTTPFEIQKPGVSVMPVFTQEVLSGFPIGGTILLTNTGSTITKPFTATVTSKTLRPHEQYIQISALPPFASQEVPLSFAKTPFLTNKTHTLTISLEDNTIDHQIRVVPFSLTKSQMIGGIGIGLFAFIIFIFARKAWRLRIFR